MITIEELDEITRRVSAFNSFAELLNAKGNYRPTIRIPRGPSEHRTLADAYDCWQIFRNDPRRAFRRYVDE